MNLKKYGHFSKDSKEFIITNPQTPRPWINYLTNEEYCAIISHNAGGYSFYKDCRTDRILRWSPDAWHFDRPGRYIYMRDTKTNKCWSASYQPLRVKPQFYEARHGLGYTITNTTYFGINTQITFFVPTQDTCEVWLVKVANKTNSIRHLELFPYAEWLLGEYHQELRYRNIMNLYNRIWYDKSHKAILAKKTAFWGDMNIKPYLYTDFFASSLNPTGYATQKDAFMGKNNTEEKPDMILSGEFKNIPLTSGEDGIACLKHNITLKPGEEKEFTIILGQVLSKGNALSKVLAKYRNVKEAKKELAAVKAVWQKRIIENIEIETPDKDFDKIINIWVKYQLYICNFWSRSPSYYHEGSGGRGYRDSCQDADSIMSINPEHGRKKILKIASLIRRDGTSAPGWADTTGPAKHRPNKDHQVWLTVTVASYIKETGDKDILNEYIPYLKDQWLGGWEIDVKYKGPSKADGEGTLFEHLEKNLNFTFDDVGEHGLPLIGHADWNDAIDAAGIKLKGESVWLAQALVRSLKILAELAQITGENKKAEEYLHKAQAMTERINNACWDGDWYIRGFTDSGTVYGSKKNDEGKIFVNTQAWAILSQVADKKRQEKILKSVDKLLNGPHGIALFYPAYSKWHEELGRISMFSEGTKENAAVFCHAATFQIVAECVAGRGTKAYEEMKKIMPDSQADYDLYKTEPYVYAEYLVGPQHPYLYGEGAFTWVTGSAGWQFMAATEWLLGARRDYEGLRIDPCIPKHWKKARIKRPFRNAVYDITIHNPRSREKGIKKLYIDGKLIQGNLIRPHSDKKTHKVEVLLG
ncbi:MAG: amylo-alpha-1,6-glucosidase [Candidatus Omnitrophota bacterium]